MHAPTLVFDTFPRRMPPSRSPYRCRWQSTTKPVKFLPMNSQQAARLYQKAERMECATRRPGRQDGAIGRNGLAVLRALLFGFLNRKTGRCDPSHAAIAQRVGISERSVRRGLVALKAAGLVNWLRRCIEAIQDGRFALIQISNAYAVLPPTQWHGFLSRHVGPPPEPGTWGDHPPLPDTLTAACESIRDRAGIEAVLDTLEADPTDELAAALARFGRASVRHSWGV